MKKIDETEFERLMGFNYALAAPGTPTVGVHTKMYPGRALRLGLMLLWRSIVASVQRRYVEIDLQLGGDG